MNTAGSKGKCSSHGWLNFWFIDLAVDPRAVLPPRPLARCLQDLKDHFGQVGSVRHADVLREGGPGSRSKGCGIVEVGGGQGRAHGMQLIAARLASSWPSACCCCLDKHGRIALLPVSPSVSPSPHAPPAV